MREKCSFLSPLVTISAFLDLVNVVTIWGCWINILFIQSLHKLHFGRRQVNNLNLLSLITFFSNLRLKILRTVDFFLWGIVTLRGNDISYMINYHNRNTLFDCIWKFDLVHFLVLITVLDFVVFFNSGNTWVDRANVWQYNRLKNETIQHAKAHHR